MMSAYHSLSFVIVFFFFSFEQLRFQFSISKLPKKIHEHTSRYWRKDFSRLANLHQSGKKYSNIHCFFLHSSRCKKREYLFLFFMADKKRFAMAERQHDEIGRNLRFGVETLGDD
jgi:hypothetical protein